MNNSTPLSITSYISPDPFGMITLGRSWEVGSEYRYGFNGNERVDEIYGDNNAVDFGARIYDSRLGRWFSVDKYQRLSTSESIYSFAGNQVLIFTDLNGNFKYPAELEKEYTLSYPILTAYLQNDIQDLAKNPHLMKLLSSYSNLPPEEIVKFLKWGEGPTIKIAELEHSNGEYSNSTITLDQSILVGMEAALKNEMQSHLLLGVSTVLHEFVHFGNDITGNSEVGEAGTNFEIALYGIDVDDTEDAAIVIDYAKTDKKIIPKAPNIQHLDDIVFDSDKARIIDDKLVVKDLVTGKDYGVVRNENGSYSYD